VAWYLLQEELASQSNKAFEKDEEEEEGKERGKKEKVEHFCNFGNTPQLRFILAL